MTGPALCCRELIGNPKVASPFDRVIVLGWYDGPTEGLVWCAACNRVYRFEMLDSVDEVRGIRVHSLSPMPAESMDRLVATLSAYMTPSWPMWAPIWKFPSKDARFIVDRAVDGLLAEAKAPEFVVTRPGLLEEIGEIRAISSVEIGQIDDWVSWMGMERSTAESV
ncbi:MAG: hypothetical protein ACLQGP_37275 [Isosphaeraceae bacterium]